MTPTLPELPARVCPWCREPVLDGEPRSLRDGDTFHLGCACEDDDDAFFDQDMEFGS